MQNSWSAKPLEEGGIKRSTRKELKLQQKKRQMKQKGGMWQIKGNRVVKVSRIMGKSYAQMKQMGRKLAKRSRHLMKSSSVQKQISRQKTRNMRVLAASHEVDYVNDIVESLALGQITKEQAQSFLEMAPVFTSTSEGISAWFIADAITEHEKIGKSFLDTEITEEGEIFFHFGRKLAENYEEAGKFLSSFGGVKLVATPDQSLGEGVVSTNYIFAIELSSDLVEQALVEKFELSEADGYEVLDEKFKKKCGKKPEAAPEKEEMEEGKKCCAPKEDETSDEEEMDDTEGSEDEGEEDMEESSKGKKIAESSSVGHGLSKNKSFLESIII